MKTKEQTRKLATDGLKSLLWGYRSDWPSQSLTPAFGLQMSQNQSVQQSSIELIDKEAEQKLNLRRKFSQSFHDKMHPIKVL